MAQAAEQKKAKEESNAPTQESNIQSGTGQGLAKRDTSFDRGLSRRDRYPFLSPFSLFDNFRTEMDRLFDDFGFGGSGSPAFGRFGRGGSFNWSPETEIFERGDELVVRADLPGLKRDDISVDLDDDSITIRGERKSEHEENQGGIYRTERSYGSFCRTIPLPEGVDGDKAKADFRDGVLEITMPKPETKPRGRKIEIGDGSAK
jgi:HSP20 family protein